MTAVLVAVTLAFLLTSAFLSAAEAAAFSLGEPRIRTLTEEGFHGARALWELRSRPGGLQTAIPALVSILHLVSAGLMMQIGLSATGPNAWPFVLGAAVAFVVVVGQIVPRAFAARWPIRLALSTAPLLLVLERRLHIVLTPALKLDRILAGRNGAQIVSSDERQVREIAELGQEEGVVDAEEHQLVERAFRLDELTARDVMTPRVDVFALSEALQLRDIIEDLSSVPYSRVPVYGDSVDDITGILYVRQAYAAFATGQKDTPLSKLAREPFFVPGSLSLAQLLRDFQARRIHMGVVADEFGGTDGLVTLEDVLEELVGEIVDETDIASEPLTRLSRDELVAQGGVDLREIMYALQVPLRELEPRSLNGLILEELGHVPEVGEAFTRRGIRIEVLEASETQVLRARLKKLPVADRSGTGKENDA